MIFKRSSTWWTDFSIDGRRYRVSLETHDHRQAKDREKEKIAEANEILNNPKHKFHVLTEDQLKTFFQTIGSAWQGELEHLHTFARQHDLPASMQTALQNKSELSVAENFDNPQEAAADYLDTLKMSTTFESMQSALTEKYGDNAKQPVRDLELLKQRMSHLESLVRATFTKYMEKKGKEIAAIHSSTRKSLESNVEKAKDTLR